MPALLVDVVQAVPVAAFMVVQVLLVLQTPTLQPAVIALQSALTPHAAHWPAPTQCCEPEQEEAVKERPVAAQVMTMPLSHFFMPGSQVLQSLPTSSQVLPVGQTIWLLNALPSVLHSVSVLPEQATLPAAHTAVVHMPATLLQSAALVHVSLCTKLMPSAAHTSSCVPVHLNSVLGTQTAHFFVVRPS